MIDIKVPLVKDQNDFPDSLGNIALLKLKNAVNFGDGNQPACLSNLNGLSMSKYSQKNLDVVGWGVRLNHNNPKEYANWSFLMSTRLLKARVKESNNISLQCQGRQVMFCIVKGDNSSNPKSTKPGTPCYIDLGDPVHATLNVKSNPFRCI